MALRFIETDIEIDAPVEAVWRVLSDVGNWPEWHPYVERVRGSLELNKALVLSKSAAEGRTISVRQVVTTLEEGVEFRLTGRLGVSGLLDNEHRFRIEAIDEERSRFFHGQAFRGFLVRLMIRRRGESTYDVFDQINEALKRRVEGTAG